MTDQPRPSTQSSRESKVIGALVQLADTLIDDYDVIEFLSTLTECCVDLVDADEAGIMLSDGRGHLQVVAASTERSRLLELLEIQNQDGPCLEAFSTGTPVTSADLTGATARWPRFAPAALEVGFRSVHSVPMRLRTDVVGAMTLLRSSTGTLEPADSDLVRALTQVATIGLLQERALSASRITSVQLQNALTSRVRIEQAKGMISERHDVDVDTAFEMLRSYARRHRRPLTELAEAVTYSALDISG